MHQLVRAVRRVCQIAQQDACNNGFLRIKRVFLGSPSVALFHEIYARCARTRRCVFQSRCQAGGMVSPDFMSLLSQPSIPCRFRQPRGHSGVTVSRASGRDHREDQILILTANDQSLEPQKDSCRANVCDAAIVRVQGSSHRSQALFCVAARIGTGRRKREQEHERESALHLSFMRKLSLSAHRLYHHYCRFLLVWSSAIVKAVAIACMCGCHDGGGTHGQPWPLAA